MTPDPNGTNLRILPLPWAHFSTRCAVPTPFPLPAKERFCLPSSAGRRDGDEGFGVRFIRSRLKLVPLTPDPNGTNLSADSRQPQCVARMEHSGIRGIDGIAGRFPRISPALHAGYWLPASRIGLSADVFFKPWIPAFAGMTALPEVFSLS